MIYKLLFGNKSFAKHVSSMTKCKKILQVERARAKPREREIAQALTLYQFTQYAVTNSRLNFYMRVRYTHTPVHARLVCARIIGIVTLDACRGAGRYNSETLCPFFSSEYDLFFCVCKLVLPLFCNTQMVDNVWV